jgi:hypothetical protein
MASFNYLKLSSGEIAGLDAPTSLRYTFDLTNGNDPIRRKSTLDQLKGAKTPLSDL